MTKENLLKEYEKAKKANDAEYMKSLEASWAKTWGEPSPKGQRGKK